jgi:hypothetical protein
MEYYTFEKYLSVVNGRTFNKKYVKKGGNENGNTISVILNQELAENIKADIVEPKVTE